MPPSTRRISPVKNCASSDARERAAQAVPKPVPILRLNGTMAFRLARTASVVRPVACAIPVTDMGVSMNPTMIALARIP